MSCANRRIQPGGARRVQESLAVQHPKVKEHRGSKVATPAIGHRQPTTSATHERRGRLRRIRVGFKEQASPLSKPSGTGDVT